MTKLKRYDPNDNTFSGQFAGMEEVGNGDWIKVDDLEIIKIKLGDIISSLKMRSVEENTSLLRKIYDSI